MSNKQTEHYESNQNAATSKNATNGQENATSPQGSAQSLGKKVLSELSGVQITASVLAAVTALLFSSNIGIAGSVIGVAVSAGITALSSSVYKSFIEGTKQKVQRRAESANGTIREKVSDNNSVPAEPAQHATSVEKAPEVEEVKRVVYSHDKNAFNPSSNKYTHAHAKHNQPKTSRLTEFLHNKWFALMVLSVIALVSVLATSHIITVATSGEGIGTKPQPIFVSNTHNQSESSTTDTSGSTTGHSTAGVNNNDSSTNKNSQSQISTSQAQSSLNNETTNEASSGPNASSSQQSGASDASGANAATSSSSSDLPDAKTPSAGNNKPNND